MKLVEINGVHGYVDENGTAQLNLEDISRGLGFIQNKNGVSYVRWDRVNGHLTDMGFPQLVGKKFIPENVFYRLSMKGESEIAVKFQTKVADEILPSIRKTGSYSASTQFALPQSMPEALRLLASEMESNALLEAKVKENEPKVALYDVAMQAQNAQPMNSVAKTLGIGRNKLFLVLREKKVLMHNNLPYQEFLDRGYFEVRQYSITHLSSGIENKVQTLVTPKGLAHIHKLIKSA